MTSSTLKRADRILVTGATGKVGSRVAARLELEAFEIRRGSRNARPCFDWERPETWSSVLDDTTAVFVSYYPDLGFPGAAETIEAFASAARRHGVTRLVLLSGRGEPEAVRSEAAMQRAGVSWTVIRCSWFAQNFSEHFLLGPVLDGVIALPAGTVTEPFVDVDDVAAVVVQALTQPGHEARTYELTGPESISFERAAAILSEVTRRSISYECVTSERFVEAAMAAGLPDGEAYGLAELFATVLDGRNMQPTCDLAQVLGRPAGSFRAYAQRTAATGVWNLASEGQAR